VTDRSKPVFALVLRSFWLILSVDR